MAVDEGSRVTAQLLQYVAGELQSAFTHIGRAMATYSQTGALPPSMFDAPAPTNKRQRRRDRGHKRKPSAFNNFVKEKMAEIRANGNEDEDHVVANGTTIFSHAVDEWKKLSDEEKKAYAEKYKADEGEEEAAEEDHGDEDMGEEEDETEHDEGEDGEEEEAEQEPAPQKPPKVEPPQAAQPVAQPASVKKEKKRKSAAADEPKKEVAAPVQAAVEEPKSEKKKKKKKDK